MSDQEDTRLQALFAEANEPLVDDNFTSQVMLLTRKRKMQWYLVGAILFALALTVASQFLQPLQSIALLVTDVLSIELIDVGDSAVAWILTPINNLATVLVVLAKGLRMSWRKVQKASFAN